MFLKLVVKSFELCPFEEESDTVKVRLYTRGDRHWSEAEEPGLNVKEQGNEGLLEKMLEMAGNQLTMWMTSEKDSGCYRFIDVEAPGASITLGEGAVKDVETILTPKPSPLMRIRIVKVEEPEKYRVIHEFKPSKESIIYDGFINIKNPDLQYDLILIDTTDDTRILLPHELILSPLKLSSESTKRRARRKKPKTSKTKRKKSKTRKKKGGKSKRK
ncbi:hypothetical protein DKAM_0802 [Desulfurococcus amylolyticus 1221n]|uniref:Uncharacterized protein n=1 Tax=Desulfurococcus amylolyticus (strain DSM 18924 / JCM 16383 / VKM B-2413 / 1221n) TaxID=490899 RepID=B8D4U7_DESA1|nr:hypothetical protein [Desulfurococcus amylolyticus]ACL11128.1 hypothetical protein DKAM_0802 [Desulfurococcus amylolyticus 1221n]